MSTGVIAPEAPLLKPKADLPGCIHEMFDAQVKRSPSGIALSFHEQRLTYRELNEQANRLANYLKRFGVGVETPVALYLERTPHMVISILAVLKAGGTYVPIDLSYPPDRLSFMLRDAQPAVLITEQSLCGKLPSQRPPLICIDEQWEDICGESAAAPEPGISRNNAAYIIYTSGSTGKPKGVVVTHHNVVRLLRQTEQWYHFNSTDVWPLFHSYAFDVSVWELWGCLFYGGRLVVVPYLVTRSPGEFYELLAREEVTVLNQTPSAFRQLIWAEAQAPIERPLKLRYVICAGEALELQSLKPWFDRHGDETPQIVNKYGITETTVHSTYRVIRKSDLTNGQGSVIGVPIPDLRIYLVNEELKVVPVGTPGEICVGGAGVARGYLNRPELTEQRFLRDPYSEEAGARLYRSGDLAQINANGELEYLGRMDHQVKIRGFRVELGEIESALNGHPGIRESVVMAQDTSVGDKRLVAYVVPVGTAPNVSELREHLGRKLPDYMIPAIYLFLDGLPLTTNGKVDRRALPAPGKTRPELKAEFVAPRSPRERTMAQIWSAVLEIEKVGVNDNFFEIGGDSIRSIRILSRAQEAGLYLALQDIFQGPTIGQLAARAQEKESRPVSRPTEAFGLLTAEDKAKLPADIEDGYPIATLQLGMFFWNELDPISAMYHDVFSYRIQARFDEGKLAVALEGLAQRHPMLRTSFHIAGFSQPVQLVHREGKMPLTVEDVRSLGAKEKEKHLEEWVEREKRRPFERTTAPLVRFHVQVRTADSFQLAISFHHACLDGWSLAAVITEICQDYAALLDGRQTQIGSPRIGYRDFLELERQTVASVEAREFWAKKLEGASVQLLPRWPKTMREGGHEQKRGPEVQIDGRVLEGLRRLAQEDGVPLKTVLLAAHQRVMSFLYGHEEVITGLISNGRPEELDGDRIVGLFLNSVPLRQTVGVGTWRELVRQTFAAEQEIVPYRRFPLAEIKRLTGGQAPFETAFDFVHFHVYEQLRACRGLDLSEGHYFEANNLTSYTTFMLDATSTRLELHIDYDPNELCRVQVERMTGYYLSTLRAIAAEPDAGSHTFSPLSESEQKELFLDWNQTGQEEISGVRIADLFEEQVRRNPDAVALVSGDEEVTYRQLDEQAELLAEALRRLKLAREELVGICVDRSAKMVIGLLGILKAGGAYLPLDPTYPKERLGFMLKDSGAGLLLSERTLLGALPNSDARVLCIEDLLAVRHVPATTPSLTGSNGQTERQEPSDPLAYVIYTSGSTGQPKGVLVNQRAVINLLRSAARTAGITSEDHLLAVTTLSFDIAGLEIFMPLITGGRLTLASRAQAGDGSQLAALMASARPTVMQGTPATWRLLIEAGWTGDKELTVFCGGEALKQELADELLRRSKCVWNFYGPTETTIWSTAWKVVPDAPVSIGRPLANTQLYILDTQLRAVPVGAAGELHIGGAGLARGYLGRDELSAEKFIASPFGTARGKRLYKTGDLARFLPDGKVECLGRVDHQVKVRGFRIEPGEVESVLRKHSAVADAVVTAREDSLGEKRLIAYVISKHGPGSTSDLREFVRAKLPLYMVPAQFVHLQRFPLTPNGKIDAARLPAPDGTSEPRRNHIAPRNADEEGLAAIWREVLMLKQVGIDDDFFELGGDSLSATRAFARTNHSFGTNLSLREMLDHPTIRTLSELVRRSKGATPARPRIRPRGSPKD